MVEQLRLPEPQAGVGEMVHCSSEPMESDKKKVLRKGPGCGIWEVRSPAGQVNRRGCFAPRRYVQPQ